MHELEIKLPSRDYKISIGKGLLDNLGERIRQVSDAKNVLVISDRNVWRHYENKVRASLASTGLSVNTILIEPGEQSKNLMCFKDVSEKMSQMSVRRDHLIIALGGGVVGDMAGFIASVYMRGLPYVQVPTTLLAQVDSSVGGKTGIDLPMGKNLLGSFHQPISVVIDVDTLHTLDKRQLSEGMAEVIKYGAICDSELFSRLEAHGSVEGVLGEIENVVFKCCSIKKDFVEQDEKDAGERQKLNFGHSFGHAIERMGNYCENTHGEAVAIGMAMGAKVGEVLGITSAGVYERILKTVGSYGLPYMVPKLMRPEYMTLIDYMGLDKKNEGSAIKLVLLKDIGESIIYNTSKDQLLSLQNEIEESKIFTEDDHDEQ
jgi:3-dehydroquinate synthase